MKPEKQISEEDNPNIEQAEKKDKSRNSNSTDNISKDDIKDKELNNLRNKKRGFFDDLLQAQQMANIYIVDARTGGIYFEGGGNTINGGVVGKNQHKKNREKSSIADDGLSFNQVKEHAIEKVQSVYIEGSAHTKCVSLLQQKHVILLRGLSHIGKWTAAIKLLSDIHGFNIFKLDPSINANKYQFPNQARGYFADTVSGEYANNLSVFLLERWSEELKGNSSHLILIIDEGVSLQKEVVDSYLVEWKSPDEYEKILINHLKWYSSNFTLEKIKVFLQQEQIKDIFKGALTPVEIDRVSELLASALTGKETLESALKKVAVHVSEQAKLLFEKVNDLNDLTLLLSIAVFNGASYQNIKESQNILQTFLPTADSVTSTNSISTLLSSRTQKIQRFGAQLKQGFEINELGKVPVEVIELDNPTLQPVIIRYVWQEYDALRDAVVQWLLSVGQHTLTDIRIRAALATGELSKQEFNYIVHKLIAVWANHDDERVRSAAALSLGIPIWDSEKSQFVLTLLHHWITMKNNWRLTWTAGVAYGSLAGFQYFDAALRDMRFLAESGDIRLLEVLATSLENLFSINEHREKILETLILWTNEKKDNETVYLSALYSFLFLAENITQKAEPEAGHWYTLHYLVDDKLYSPLLVKLWVRSLNYKLTRRYALDLLQEWVSTTDEDIRLYPKLKTLISSIRSFLEGDSNRNKERIDYYLNQWANKPFQFTTAIKLIEDEKLEETA